LASTTTVEVVELLFVEFVFALFAFELAVDEFVKFPPGWAPHPAKDISINAVTDVRNTPRNRKFFIFLIPLVPITYSTASHPFVWQRTKSLMFERYEPIRHRLGFKAHSADFADYASFDVFFLL
jgi:hypothetical protein